MLAMGMQESTHLDVRERDASKDNRTDKSANATLFNLSVVRAQTAVQAPEGALVVPRGSWRAAWQHAWQWVLQGCSLYCTSSNGVSPHQQCWRV